MKKDRHAKVEVICEWCSSSFLARLERVNNGQGRFCSKEHYHLWHTKYQKENVWGRKDLATCYKSGSRYCARWYDENGKTKSSSYSRWWWEMNVGEIPPNMIVMYKDADPTNLDPQNFVLGTKSDALVLGNQTRKNDPALWETYTSKLREKSTGRHHTAESKRKLSIAHLGKPTLSGEKHYRWRGGIPKDYPKEFYEIRQFVIDRDQSKCQVCSRSLSKNQHVHHRDGDRNHNDQDNLLTLCASCHGKLHSSTQESQPIMALRSELHWNRN